MFFAGARVCTEAIGKANTVRSKCVGEKGREPSYPPCLLVPAVSVLRTVSMAFILLPYSSPYGPTDTASSSRDLLRFPLPLMHYLSFASLSSASDRWEAEAESSFFACILGCVGEEASESSLPQEGPCPYGGRHGHGRKRIGWKGAVGRQRRQRRQRMNKILIIKTILIEL